MKICFLISISFLVSLHIESRALADLVEKSGSGELVTPEVSPTPSGATRSVDVRNLLKNPEDEVAPGQRTTKKHERAKFDSNMRKPSER